MKILFVFLSSVLIFSCTSKKEKNIETNEKILFVVTSHSKLGNTGKTTGAYIGEITHPYKVFS